MKSTFYWIKSTGQICQFDLKTKTAGRVIGSWKSTRIGTGKNIITGRVNSVPVVGELPSSIPGAGKAVLLRPAWDTSQSIKFDEQNQSKSA